MTEMALQLQTTYYRLHYAVQKHTAVTLDVNRGNSVESLTVMNMNGVFFIPHVVKLAELYASISRASNYMAQ